MTTIQEIEAAIRLLTPADRAKLFARFEEDAADWDRKIEADVAQGKLDWLADEAKADLKAGRCTDL